MKNLKFINASNYCITPCGKLFSLRVNSFMKGWVIYGYRKFSITFDDGTRKEMFCHRLVAQAFLQNDEPEEKTLVNHIDGDKLNNHKDNLEWVTPSENNYHAYETNLSTGKKHTNENLPYLKGVYVESSQINSLSEEDVHTVCKLLVEGYRDVDISRMTEIPRRVINYIRHKDPRIHPEILNQYTFSFIKEERMSPEQVVKICEMLQDGWKVMELSRHLGLNRKKVGNIKSRKTFKDISKGYKW